jgi:hypothetical protein
MLITIARRGLKYLRHTKKIRMEILLWFAIFIGIFINDITLQATEEIMVSYWFWTALGGIMYIANSNKIDGVSR